MPELEKFVSKTLDENKEDLQNFEEFQKILKHIQKKEKSTYLTHEISSNT